MHLHTSTYNSCRDNWALFLLSYRTPASIIYILQYLYMYYQTIASISLKSKWFLIQSGRTQYSVGSLAIISTTYPYSEVSILKSFNHAIIFEMLVASTLSKIKFFSLLHTLAKPLSLGNYSYKYFAHKSLQNWRDSHCCVGVCYFKIRTSTSQNCKMFQGG